MKNRWLHARRVPGHGANSDTRRRVYTLAETLKTKRSKHHGSNCALASDGNLWEYHLHRVLMDIYTSRTVSRKAIPKRLTIFANRCQRTGRRQRSLLQVCRKEQWVCGGRRELSMCLVDGRVRWGYFFGARGHDRGRMLRCQFCSRMFRTQRATRRLRAGLVGCR